MKQLWYLASIGILAPQKYVWKICIALHSAPRLLLCKMYHKHMQKVLSRMSTVQWLALFTCLLNVAEVFSLLLLSVVPSTEDYSLHTFCFGLFLFFSASYLAFSFYLFRYFCKSSPNYFKTISLLPVLAVSPQDLILTGNPFTTRGGSWWPTLVPSWGLCIATGDIIHTVSLGCIQYSHSLNTLWCFPTWPTTSPPTMTSTTSTLVLAPAWPLIKIAWATSQPYHC